MEYDRSTTHAEHLIQIIRGYRTCPCLAGPHGSQAGLDIEGEPTAYANHPRKAARGCELPVFLQMDIDDVVQDLCE